MKVSRVARRQRLDIPCRRWDACLSVLSEERAREKRASRDQDATDLVSGLKTRERLRAERSAFVFPRMRVRLDLARVR